MDHSLDIPAFSVFVPVQRLKFLGLRDKDDNIVDVCTGIIPMMMEVELCSAR